MVWLSSKNIKTTRPTKKLSGRWLGLFPLLKKVRTHVLETVKTSIIPNRHQEPPTPITIEEEDEWEVSKILVSKIKRGKFCYLVELKGFSQDPERSTWEPTKNLQNCPELVKDFHSLYPDKPGPNSSSA
ncbi:hypothetical protein O181_043001 [Austropuccinia psidii MF-1]|uniref:Chromo domain-containing protein n=1 Tax=Austropuccinia psidii MF-1 TaxID=1389203 RepID=A0A9Q3DMN3_9BASI|nr:hypothetical protein [Austropuccinia psidii MF-1]